MKTLWLLDSRSKQATNGYNNFYTINTSSVYWNISFNHEFFFFTCYWADDIEEYFSDFGLLLAYYDNDKQ